MKGGTDGNAVVAKSVKETKNFPRLSHEHSGFWSLASSNFTDFVTDKNFVPSLYRPHFVLFLCFLFRRLVFAFMSN